MWQALSSACHYRFPESSIPFENRISTHFGFAIDNLSAAGARLFDEPAIDDVTIPRSGSRMRKYPLGRFAGRSHLQPRWPEWWFNQLRELARHVNRRGDVQ